MTYITDYLCSLTEVVNGIDHESVETVVDLFWNNYTEGRRLVFCGNGGSAGSASHLPADFQKNVFLAGGRPWECMSLVDSVPLLTAWSNDTSFEYAFAGQAKCWLRRGDLLVAISGSGNSANVLAAVDAAKQQGAMTIGWCGYGGGKLAKSVDYAIVLESHNMQIVEDVHMIIGHLIFTEIRARILSLQHPD